MIRRRLFWSAMTVTTLLALMSIPSLASATPGGQVEEVDESAPSGWVGEIDESAPTSGGKNPRMSSLAPCLHWGDSDDVHWSTTNPGAISVHGYWDGLSPGCNGVKATVTVELQRYVCYYHNGVKQWCGFSTINTARRSGRSRGSGSANRVTAQYHCQTQARQVTWRALVDVDLEGRWDPATKWDVGYEDLWCSTY